MTLNRRTFLGTTAAAAATLSAPMVHAAGHGKPHVVVVGGGAGGATAARYLAKDSKGEINVTLIEPTRMYYTCFFSNLYLGHRCGPRCEDGCARRWRLGVLRQTDPQPRH